MHHQSIDLGDTLEIIRQYQQSHKIVIIVDDYPEGKKIIRQIDEAIKAVKENTVEKIEEIVHECQNTNDSLDELVRKMIENTKKRSSTLHLKCLINESQNKIQRIHTQLNQQKEGTKPPKIDKKRAK